MNIVEFLGLPAEHAQEIMDNAASHLKARTAQVLRERGAKIAESTLTSEQLIAEVFRQQLLDAAAHGLKAKVDDYVKTKFSKK